ncbi:hypothetical protein J7E63_25235 [Bacillus sp. ISL-75]|uniref:thiamine pyrophosphate-binding protein n=1 Tax=Bacillus sp. ISL-75 TaxID=2819137 RepID=UPI001BEBD825|nr:thiamine pyrophosphate-binding protein [Bacillus sp. ISL-75]MBT2730163.1 hypothetical protein [Bacillus sp. ISL-75]
MTLLKEFSDVEMFLNSLSSLGVDCFFGCDEQELMLLKDKNVRYVRMQHEQAAVHAADGFARATGKPGVVLLTTASGITNSITGIATAYSDSVPLVIIAGQIQDDPLHTNHEAFHEFLVLWKQEPLYLGILGMHGTFAANKAVHHCDLLISIGVRFSDRVTGRISGFSPSSKKIYVEEENVYPMVPPNHNNHQTILSR